MGFVEGHSVAIEYRWAEGQFDLMPGMAADLVARKVAVILVGGNLGGTRAVIAATQSIPIVFTTTNDPVASGLVTSLNRPGGNVTGVTSILYELLPKLLELLHEAIPGARKFALLTNPRNPEGSQTAIEAAQMAARSLGLEVFLVNAGTEIEIERAFEAALEQRASAIIVSGDAYLNSQHDGIARLAQRHALPFVGGSDENIAAGMLMSYRASTPDVYRQAGLYVGRILKGEKPANLPVLQPTKFELVINNKTAKVLGLTVPETLLATADQVIE
jgi:putative tryptophan/tyrosine transport system substrate-binding protein